VSFRLRLTFFGAALVALTVLAFGWLVYTLATNTQGTTQDDALRQRAADAQAAIAAAPASQLSAPGTLTGAEDLTRRTDPFIEVLTSTGTVLLKGRFPNHDGTLWPGEYVNITLVLGTQTDAIVVPSQAVMQGQQGTYVFVVNNDGTATSQPITVQRTLDSLSVIAGVPAGALVVTDGQLRLTPNAKVDIRGGPTTETAGGGGAGTNGAETTR